MRTSIQGPPAEVVRAQAAHAQWAAKAVEQAVDQAVGAAEPAASTAMHTPEEVPAAARADREAQQIATRDGVDDDAAKKDKQRELTLLRQRIALLESELASSAGSGDTEMCAVSLQHIETQMDEPRGKPDSAVSLESPAVLESSQREDRRFGDDLVGARVAVKWDTDDGPEWFHGAVQKYDCYAGCVGKHQVEYDIDRKRHW